MTGWKAVRVSSCGSIWRGTVVPTLRFLYHTHNGSAVIPRGVWLEAKAKWVHNPGKKIAGRSYRAGFQYLKTRADVRAFDKLTKGKYSFIKVQVRQVWRKPTEGSKSMMARFLFVPDHTKTEWY